MKVRLCSPVSALVWYCTTTALRIPHHLSAVTVAPMTVIGPSRLDPLMPVQASCWVTF